VLKVANIAFSKAFSVVVSPSHVTMKLAMMLAADRV
jgi:hypothetical protein